MDGGVALGFFRTGIIYRRRSWLCAIVPGQAGAPLQRRRPHAGSNRARAPIATEHTEDIIARVALLEVLVNEKTT